MSTKFSSNPYNPNNSLIQSKDVLHLLKTHSIDEYSINNLTLFQTAFVHKSYCPMKDYEQYENTNKDLELQKTSYETLEFLGDALLGSVVCSYLYKRYQPHGTDEGFLTRMKNRIVSGESLSRLADDMDFNKYLIISKHIEDNCNGRHNKNILEDTFEAFIGALYEDSNDYEIVEKYILYILETYIDFTELIVVNTNYKDQLLRYLQTNFKTHPKYEIQEQGTSFSCSVYNQDTKVCQGVGETKKKAEQNASKEALKYYGVLN
jgi:ribonuclease-3